MDTVGALLPQFKTEPESRDVKMAAETKSGLGGHLSPSSFVHLGIGFVIAFTIGSVVALNPVRYSMLAVGLTIGSIALIRPQYGFWGMLASPAFIYFGKRLEFYVLLDPSSEFNNPVSLIPEFLVGLLLLTVLTRKSLRSRFRLHREKLTCAVTALFILAALQVFNPASSLQVGFFGFRTFGYYILAFFISTVLIQTSQHLRTFIQFTLLLAAIVASYGVFQQIVAVPPWDQRWFLEFLSERTFSWLAGYRFSWEELRKFSTMQHPPAAANLYLFAILLGAPFLSRVGTKTWLIALLTLPIIALGLFFTYVRGGWVGTLGGLMAMAVLWKVPNPRRYTRVSVFLYAGIVLIALLALASVAPRVLSSSVVQQLSPGVEQRVKSLADPLKSPEIQVRFNYWHRALAQIQETPLGSGIGMTGGVAQRFEGFGVVDNLYLKMLLELGWISVILFSIMLFLSLRNAWRLYRMASQPLIAGFGLSVVSILVAIGLEGFVQPTLEMSIAAIYFWSVLGVLNSLSYATGIR